MVDVSIALIGANNDQIVLSDAGDYVLGTGVSGFGVPPVLVRIAESAGDGGVWRHTKRGIREIDFPITTLGTDRGDVETKLRRLANLLQDRKGATRLVANYSDGTSYQLLVHYTGGADAEYGTDSNRVFARWVITLQAPQPYWESVNPTTYTLQQSTGGRGLLPQLTKLKLSGQYGFGSVALGNPGDVPAYPVWQVVGPVSSATFTLNGVGFSYDAAIAGDESVTIDTYRGTVVDQDGINRYANLAAAPKFFAIEPGSQVVEIDAPGATAQTIISGYIKPRREVIH